MGEGAKEAIFAFIDLIRIKRTELGLVFFRAVLFQLNPEPIQEPEHSRTCSSLYLKEFYQLLHSIVAFCARVPIRTLLVLFGKRAKLVRVHGTRSLPIFLIVEIGADLMVVNGLLGTLLGFEKIQIEVSGKALLVCVLEDWSEGVGSVSDICPMIFPFHLAFPGGMREDLAIYPKRGRRALGIQVVLALARSEFGWVHDWETSNTFFGLRLNFQRF